MGDTAAGNTFRWDTGYVELWHRASTAVPGAASRTQECSGISLSPAEAKTIRHFRRLLRGTAAGAAERDESSRGCCRLPLNDGRATEDAGAAVLTGCGPMRRGAIAGQRNGWAGSGRSHPWRGSTRSSHTNRLATCAAER
jgi:hypothetical protein